VWGGVLPLLEEVLGEGSVGDEMVFFFGRRGLRGREITCGRGACFPFSERLLRGGKQFLGSSLFPGGISRGRERLVLWARLLPFSCPEILGGEGGFPRGLGAASPFLGGVEGPGRRGD